MQLLIDGNVTDITVITVNDGLNFGRLSNISKSHISEYEIVLTKEEFVQLVEPNYNSIRNEIKQDDIQFNDSSEFSQTGYCSLQELLDHEKELDLIFKNYLDRELFIKIFPSTETSLYIINSTDTIIVDNGLVKISGRAFEKSIKL